MTPHSLTRKEKNMSYQKYFKDFWEYAHGSAGSLQFMRHADTTDLPHAVILEAGTLLMSTWVEWAGDDLEFFENQLWDLHSFAERIVQNKPNGDWEKKLSTTLFPIDSGDVKDEPEDEIDTSDDQLFKKLHFEFITKTQANAETLNKIIDSTIQKVITRNGQSISQQWIAVPFEESKKGYRLPLKNPAASIYQTDGKKDEIHVAAISFGDLHDVLLKPLGLRLFAENIRGFIGIKGVTNSRLKKAFEDVAQEGANSEKFQLFPFMNNGLTLTCMGCNVIQNENAYIQIFSPQLINGQQTIRAWESVYLKEKKKDDKKGKVLEELSVMVRIIFIHNKNLVKQVAFANNRQNPISAVDLRSNEESLKILEKNFDNIDVPFVRKKGEYLEPERKVIKGYQRAVDAKKIFTLYNLLNNNVSSEEAFFDDQTKFNQLFGGLAEKTDDPEKTKRLVGLVNVATIPAVGARRRDTLLQLLMKLGLDGKSFPNRGEQPSFRRQMLHACWKKTQSAILHGLLSNKTWEGANELIHTYFSDEEPAPGLINLIEVKLTSDLANKINGKFDKWKEAKTKKKPWPFDVDSESLEQFAQQLRLSSMLKWNKIKQCDLIEDL
jgi:hypothetical protein